MLAAQPVFNLSVEGTEEYFANGILVHNCRYGIAGHLLDAEDEPDEVKLKRRLDKIEDPFRKHVEQYRAWIEKKKEQENPSKIIIMPTWQSRLKQ